MDDLESLLDEAIASASQSERGYFSKEPVRGWVMRFLERRKTNPELTLTKGYEIVKHLATKQEVPGRFPTKSTFEACVRRLEDRG